METFIILYPVVADAIRSDVEHEEAEEVRAVAKRWSITLVPSLDPEPENELKNYFDPKGTEEDIVSFIEAIRPPVMRVKGVAGVFLKR